MLSVLVEPGISGTALIQRGGKCLALCEIWYAKQNGSQMDQFRKRLRPIQSTRLDLMTPHSHDGWVLAKSDVFRPPTAGHTPRIKST